MREIMSAMLLCSALLGGCGDSHSPSDAGPGRDAARRDGGSPDAGSPDAGCPPASPVSCVRGPCCDADPRLAERVPGTCDFACPDGWVEDALCDPAVGCIVRACTDNAECVLAANSCCGPCGVPALTDFDAINAAQASAHHELVCPTPETCPDCPSAFNPSLGATCDAGGCAGFDVRDLPLSACTRDADCRLRVRECCECGGDTSPYMLIAIRTDAETDYTSLVCPVMAGCARCVPTYPAGVTAVCSAGRCGVIAMGSTP